MTVGCNTTLCTAEETYAGARASADAGVGGGDGMMSDMDMLAVPPTAGAVDGSAGVTRAHEAVARTNNARASVRALSTLVQRPIDIARCV
jgi:hypothetical protein